MVYIENIQTSQQVYIPRQTVNTGSSTNGGCINLEDYYTREETDALISTMTGVSQEYVDSGDAATLQAAKDYTDSAVSGITGFVTQAELEAAIQVELERATAAETALSGRIDKTNLRIDGLFGYEAQTLYLNNEDITSE